MASRDFKIAAGVGAATVALIAGGLWWDQARTSEAGDGYVSTYQPAADPVPVAFLGDSYTEAPSSYVGTVSELMCWTPQAFGQGGTGYVNEGQAAENETNYAGRVQEVIDTDPAIVIVQGSSNDKESVTGAASSLYKQLREGLPDATIIALGPLTPPRSNPAIIAATADELSSAAAASDVTFIDARDWLADSPELFEADQTHPTTEGHRQIGTKLAESLEGKAAGCA